MLYIKQIEEELNDLAIPMDIPEGIGLHVDEVLKYIVDKCHMNGIEIQYDKLSYCTECNIQPTLLVREDHGGMAGSWHDYYHYQCPGCNKRTNVYDDWWDDYRNSLIKEWNKINV